MLIIYGIPACNTMKKTFDYLQSKGIPFEFHNYKKLGISTEKLEEFIQKLGIEKVFNKQGSTFRQLDEATKISLQDPKAAFQFLHANNSAIKRPIMTDGIRIIVGLNVNELDVWLNN